MPGFETTARLLAGIPAAAFILPALYGILDCRACHDKKYAEDMTLISHCFKYGKDERKAHATQYGFMCSATAQICSMHLTALVLCNTRDAAIITAVAAAGRFLDVLTRFTVPAENYQPGMWLKTQTIQTVHTLINAGSATMLWYAHAQ